MGDEAGAKEGFFAVHRSVDELIDDDEITGRHFLAETATGGHRNDLRNPCPFQRVNIGAVVNVGGGQAMAAPMAGQKHQFGAV